MRIIRNKNLIPKRCLIIYTFGGLIKDIRGHGGKDLIVANSETSSTLLFLKLRTLVQKKPPYTFEFELAKKTHTFKLIYASIE